MRALTEADYRGAEMLNRIVAAVCAAVFAAMVMFPFVQ